MKPEQVIYKIRSEEYDLREDGSPKPEIKKHFQRMKRLADEVSEGLYERTDHFIFELIQNAEDNDYDASVTSKLQFLLLEEDPTGTTDSKGCLCIFNNECGFKEENVKAICDFNNSTKKSKKSQGFIGEKGLGFKSVFMVTDSPHIYSNGYRFKFLCNDPVATIGYVIPYWLENIPDIVKQQPDVTTSILLPLKGDNYQFIKEKLEAFVPETLLFLKKLQILAINTMDAEQVVKCDIDRNIKSLSRMPNEDFPQKKFWVTSSVFDVPDDLHEEKRKGIERSEITVAFPLGSVTGNERLFAYLPTEEKPGFPFYVNADFLLPTSREKIKKDNNWNDWLLEQVPKVVVKGIMQMLKDDEYKYQSYSYIPLLGKEGTPDYVNELIKSVHNALRDMPCILSDRSGFIRSEKSYISLGDLRGLLGGDRPLFFNDNDLINREIIKYREQLKLIGVSSLAPKNIKEFFDDDEWVSNHDNDWLIKAYKFLTNFFKDDKSYLQFKIIRTDDGQFVTPGKVFLPVKKEIEQKITKIPKKYRRKIHLISDALHHKIKMSEEDLLVKLKLQEFSADIFLEKIFIPEIHSDIKTKELSSKEYQALFSFFIHLSTDLSDEDLKRIGCQMPFLCDDDEIYLKNLLHDHKEIVYPKKWDEDRGWQKVFVSKKERNHLYVLHDFYTELKEKSVGRYFNAIRATDIPDAVIVTLNAEKANPGVTKEYFEKHKNKSFNTWAAPYILQEPSAMDASTRKALISWLKRILKPREKHLRYAETTPYLSTDEKYDSEIFYALVNTPWIATSKGLKRPGEIFINNATIYGILGDTLSYLEDDLSEDVIDFLGIHREVTKDSLINFLKQLKSGANPEKEQLIKIYDHLDKFCNDFEEAFKTEALIYVGSNDGRWLRSGEVIWNDGSAVAGDNFGWLSCYYQETLKNFFVDKLGVNEAVEDKAYLKAWLDIQTQQANGSNVEAIMAVAIPAAIRAIEENSADDFLEKALLFTQDKSWHKESEVFVPDDGSLQSLFADQLHYIWIPDELSYSNMEPLFKAFSIQRLSQAAEYSIENVLAASSQQTKQYLTEYTIWLIARVLFNLAGKDQDDILGDVKVLISCQELEVDELNVKCTVGYRTKYIDSSGAFLDFKNQQLFVKRNADRYDVFDDLADQLSRFLLGNRAKKYRDTLWKLIGIQKKTRYEKLRDSDNWHLPDEICKQLESLLGELQHDVEDKPTENEKGPDTPAPTTAQPTKPLVSGGSPSGARNAGGTAWHNTGPGNTSQRTNTPPARPRQGTGGGSPSPTTSAGDSPQRNRMRSYVASGSTQASDTASDLKNQELGGKGEQKVLRALKAEGWNARCMPKGNHGYDIEATNTDGQRFYIEVKSNSFDWCERGVAITREQYNFATDKQGEFVLAVVENLDDHAPPEVIHYLRDPVSNITEYWFDDGWRDLATCNIDEL